ncbi:ER membrane insertion protein [Schizosaccharomyces cryophilus OY26]|uniref:ER membrane insertion protein n=1 Tax=Schizosaccharomyces cryophilus (strain OY26 / ATCC MYA-4695 / CBS 11777 / NBRC 106824 / NRRL Y48691) TaxID=653667 RepID=S9X843_SCHCR|nr:ER membrane insertion protein [Schizosaccharomyces cryophilus OY26]EPY49911.1 ER membrane insertion protein [Schizosaccharomyces cryophilus OY26]
MSVMEAKIKRAEARLREDPYEGHQMIRTLVNRQVMAKKYDDSIALLYSGAKTLFELEQTGSAGDLSIYLVDVFIKASSSVSMDNKAKALALLGCFPAEEGSKKQYVKKLLEWTNSTGPQGDRDVHASVGIMFMKWGDPVAAERHLVLGNEKCPALYAEMLYNWAQASKDEDPALFIGRAVLNYLLVGSPADALQSLTKFVQLFERSGHSPEETFSIDGIRVPTFNSYPFLNYLHLLVLAAYRKDKETYLSLSQKYPKKPEWESALAKLEDVYFGIRPVNTQPNILANLMSSLFTNPSGGRNAIDLE